MKNKTSKSDYRLYVVIFLLTLLGDLLPGINEEKNDYSITKISTALFLAFTTVAFTYCVVKLLAAAIVSQIKGEQVAQQVDSAEAATNG